MLCYYCICKGNLVILELDVDVNTVQHEMAGYWLMVFLCTFYVCTFN